MIDETEDARRQRVADINASAGPRAELEAKYGQVWDTDELVRDFQALGFMAPSTGSKTIMEQIVTCGDLMRTELSH